MGPGESSSITLSHGLQGGPPTAELMGSRPRRSRGRTSGATMLRMIAGVVGEVLLTVGLVLILFVGWDLWWTNLEADAKHHEVAREFAQHFDEVMRPGPTTEHGSRGLADPPASGTTIGIMYIPRFGANYSRPIVQGTTPDVLDSLGLGHYTQTAMPGALGNFAVAGHRQTHGAVLDNIHTLVPGDRVYIQTLDAFYVYVFRNSEVVLPSETNVLAPVPGQPAVTPTERILTMTSCNPRFDSTERIIAYSVLESSQPASTGPPSEIAGQVAAIRKEG